MSDKNKSLKSIFGAPAKKETKSDSYLDDVLSGSDMIEDNDTSSDDLLNEADDRVYDFADTTKKLVDTKTLSADQKRMVKEEETRRKEKYYDENNVLQRFGDGVNAGSRQMAGGVAYGLGELAEDVVGQKEQNSLSKWGQETIKGSPEGYGLWYEAGNVTPQAAGIAAAVATAPYSGGASTALTYGNLAVLTGSAFGGSLHEYDEYMKAKGIDPEEDQTERYMVASLTAAAEFAAERFMGIGKYLPKGKIASTTLTPKFLKSGVHKKIFKEFAERRPAQYATLMNFVKGGGTSITEGVEESLTEIMNMTTEMVYKDEADQDIRDFHKAWERTFQAFRGGLMMGGMLHPVTSRGQKWATDERRKTEGVHIAEAKDGNYFEVLGTDDKGIITGVDKYGIEVKVTKDDIVNDMRLTGDQFQELGNGILSGKGTEQAIKMSANNQYDAISNQETGMVHQARNTRKEGVEYYVLGNEVGGVVPVFDVSDGSKKLVSKEDIEAIAEPIDKDTYVNSIVEANNQQIAESTQLDEEMIAQVEQQQANQDTPVTQEDVQEPQLEVGQSAMLGEDVVTIADIVEGQVLVEQDGQVIPVDDPSQLQVVETVTDGKAQYPIFPQEDGSQLIAQPVIKESEASKMVKTLNDAYSGKKSFSYERIVNEDPNQPDSFQVFSISDDVQAINNKVDQSILEQQEGDTQAIQEADAQLQQGEQVLEGEQAINEQLAQESVVYSHNEKPISKGVAKAKVRLAQNLEDLAALNYSGDPEIQELINKKFPATYKFGKEKIEREDVLDLIEAADNIEQLNNLKIENDADLLNAVQEKFAPKIEEVAEVVEEKPLPPENQAEFPKWALENSENSEEIQRAYDQETEQTPYSKLEDWQKEIIDGGITTTKESFSEWGDPKNIANGLAKKFIRKDGVPIDIIATEFFGMEGTAEELSAIAEFMTDVTHNSSNYRKTTDVQNGLSQKHKQLTGEGLNKTSKPKKRTVKTHTPKDEFEATNQAEIAFIQSKLDDPNESTDQKEYWVQDIEDLKSDPAKYWKTFDITNLEGERKDEIVKMQEHYGVKETTHAPTQAGEVIQNVSTKKEIEKESKKVETDPSEAQKEAGNYKKGHIKINGFDITIEQPKGSIRKGVDENGNAWESEMKQPYGYFKRTLGKDGDQVDVFIGENTATGSNYVIDQVNPETGIFDEHKVMMGFNSEQEALDAYNSNYEDGWKGAAAVSEMNNEQLKEWVNDGTRTKVAASQRHVDPEKNPFGWAQEEQDAVQSPEITINDMPSGKSFIVSGETYPIKDKIKELGGRWNRKHQGWIFPLSKKDEVSEALGVQSHESHIEEKATEQEVTKPVEEKKETESHKLSDDIPLPGALIAVTPAETPNHGIAKKNQRSLNKFVDDIRKSLGFEWDKDRKGKERKVSINIAPIGGDVSFRLWKPDSNVGVEVYISYNFNDDYDNPRYEREGKMMIRSVVNKNGGRYQTGSNQWVLSNVPQAELAKKLEKIVTANVEYLERQKSNNNQKDKDTEQQEVIEKKEQKPIVESKENQELTPEQQAKIDRDARIAELNSKLKSKLSGQLNMGFDPEVFALGAELGMLHLQNGLVKFKKFAKQLFSDLGESVKPHMKSFYDGARHQVSPDIQKEMDTPEYVMNADVDSILTEKEDTEQKNKDAEVFWGAVSFELNADEKLIDNVLHSDEQNGKLAITKAVDDTRLKTRNHFVEKDQVSIVKSGIELQDEYKDKVVNEVYNRIQKLKSDETTDRNESSGSVSDTLSGEQAESVTEPSEEQAGASDNGGTESSTSDDIQGGGSQEGNSMESSKRESDSNSIGGNDNGGHTTNESEGSGETKAEPNKSKKVQPKGFRIETRADIIPRGDKAKINANLEAIRIIKSLQKSGKQATPNQMKKLAKYTGWGGLANIFQWNHDQNSDLRKLLTREEFQSAEQSTTTAYYTEPEVISSIWAMAEKLGFNGGSVLEPAGGVGHFFGMMPENLRGKSYLRGGEIDSITGEIFKQLYPDGDIRVEGFEKSDVPNNSQDLIVTNVPFGRQAPYDKSNKDLSKFNLHNYFIAKSVRKLKAGGIGVFVTSASTMDNASKGIDFRRWLQNESGGNSDVIDAIRLPNNAFKANAGTDVTADIIIIRKRDKNGVSPYAQDIIGVESIGTDTITERVNWEDEEVEKEIFVNTLFAKNPARMLGTMGFGGMYRGDSQTLNAPKNMDVSGKLKEFIEVLPDNLHTSEKGIVQTKQSNEKEGSLVEREGKLMIIEDGQAVDVDVNSNKVAGKTKTEVLHDYNSIKDTSNDLLEAESNGKSDDDLKPLRKALNKAYDNFVKKYGYFHANKKATFLKNDIDYPLMAALEDVKETPIIKDGNVVGNKDVVSKTDIFSKRMIGVPLDVKAETPEDAIHVSLHQKGTIDTEYIAELLGIDEEQAKKELLNARLAFADPSTGRLIDKDTYLSGNVRKKLTNAEESNQEGEFDKNISELKNVIPDDVPIHLVNFTLGSTWIPSDLYEKWFDDKFDCTVKVKYAPQDGKMYVSPGFGENSAKSNSLGVTGASGVKIAIDAIQNRSTTVKDSYYDPETRTTKTKTNIEETTAANMNQKEFSIEFMDWIKAQDGRLPELERIYNDNFNSLVEKTINSVDITHFPNSNHDISLRDHQKKGVLRALSDSVLLFHQVGTGKTYTLISAAMEMKRLGLAKKPCIVVQRSTFKQFASEIKNLYPNAKILIPSKRDLKESQRKQLFAKIAYNDWDIVVLYHSYLDKIPDNPERVRQYIMDKISEKESILDEVEDDYHLSNRIKTEIDNLKKKYDEAGSSEPKQRKVKDRARSATNIQNKMERLLDRQTDNVRNFEEIGIDALLIDEAHTYKKLGFETNKPNLKGVDTGASQKAQSAHLKIKYVQEKNNGRNVVLATGTPISNTMAEMWTFMRYLNSDNELRESGVGFFDNFSNNFGETVEGAEFTTSGQFKVVERFAKYINMPELMRIWKRKVDTVLTSEVQELSDKIPAMESGKEIDVILPQSESLKKVMAAIRKTLENFETLTGKEKQEKKHIPLVMFGLAKRAAIDVRLVDHTLPDELHSKTNRVVENTFDTYERTSDYKGTQLIFCDSYRNVDKASKKELFNVYEEIKSKLIEKGISESEIAILNEYKSDEAKEKLFAKVNSGDVRVVLGSTEKLGIGVNVQRLLASIHHIDAPIRPMDYEQRQGRILRQGNTHKDMGKTVKIERYGVEKTLDVTAYQRLDIKKKFIEQVMDSENNERDIEDEDLEDVSGGGFSAMMANLSGSKAAMALTMKNNQAKKLRSAQRSHSDNQARINTEIKGLEGSIPVTKRKVKELQELKSKVDETYKPFADGNIDSIEFNGIEGTEKFQNFLRDNVTPAIDKIIENMRIDVEMKAEKLLKIKFNGVEFDVDVKVVRANLATDKAEVNLTLHSPEFGKDNRDNWNVSWNPVGTASGLLSSVRGLTNPDRIDSQIEDRKRGLKRNTERLTEYKKQLGKGFKHEDALSALELEIEQLQKQVEEEFESIDTESASDVNLTVEQEGEDNTMAKVVVGDYSGVSTAGEALSKLSQQKDSVGKQIAIQKLVNNVIEDMPGTSVTVVTNLDELPKDMALELKKYDGKVQGAFNKKTGEVYVISDNINEDSEVRAVILHENLAHKGLRTIFGESEQLHSVLDRVYESMSDADKINFGDLYGTDNKRLIAEEYIAHIAESYKKPALMNRVISKVRELIRNMFGLEYSHNDIMSLLAKAERGFKYQSKPQSKDFKGNPAKYAAALAMWMSGKGNPLKTDGGNYSPDTQKAGDKFRKHIQDRMIPVRRVMEEVKSRKGKIGEFTNPYRQENLSHGRVKNEMERINKEVVEPLVQKVADIVKKKGTDYEGINDYMKAKHAEERNITMAERNEEEYDPNTTNFSGKTTAQANKIIQEFENGLEQQEIKEFWDSIHALSSYSLYRYSQDGFMNHDTYRKVSSEWEYYVPLREWKEDESDQFDFEYSNPMKGTGTGGGNPMKRAEGRKSEANDPLQYLVNMAHQAIIMGEKNKIGKAAYMLASVNSQMDDLFTIKKSWMVESGVDAEGNATYQEVFVKPEQELFDNGQVKQRVNRNQVVEGTKNQQEKKQHSVESWMNGERYIVEFSNPEVANAINRNDGTGNVITDKILNTIRPVTRFLVSNFTGKNPAFIPVNAVRDIAYVYITQSMKYGMKNPVKFAKQLHRSRMTIAKWQKGKKSDDVALYEKFKEHGGETGYIHMKDVDEMKVQLQKDIEAINKSKGTAKGVAMDILHRTGEFLENWSVRAENLSRFAVYLNEFEEGKTHAEAAYQAKEASVNFNRKGQYSSSIGALYAFFNATIQGSHNALSLANKNKKGFAIASASFFGMGMTNALLHALLDDEEEDEASFKNQSDYLKKNYMTIKVSKEKYLSIPLPHFFRAFYGAGVSAFENLFTEDGEGAGKLAQETGQLLIENLSPVNPVSMFEEDGGLTWGSIASVFSPTAIVPIVDISRNRDFAGRKIVPENFTKSQDKHQAEAGLYYDHSVNPWILKGTDALYKQFGGNIKTYTNQYIDWDNKASNEEVPYLTDWSPAKIQHLLTYYLGGRGKFWTQVVTTGSSAVDGANKFMNDEPHAFDEMNTNEFPILSRFIRTGYDSKPLRTFWDLKNEVRDFDASIDANVPEGQEARALINTDIENKRRFIEVIEEQINPIEEQIEEINDMIDKLGAASDPSGVSALIESRKELEESQREIIKNTVKGLKL